MKRTDRIRRWDIVFKKKLITSTVFLRINVPDERALFLPIDKEESIAFSVHHGSM